MRKETKGEEKNVNKFGDAVDIGVVFEDSDLYRKIDFQGPWSEEIQEEVGKGENDDDSLIHDTNMLIMQSEKAKSEIDEIEVSEKKSTREIKVLEKKSTGEMMAESVASFVIADKDHSSPKKSPWAQLKALKADLALK